MKRDGKDDRADRLGAATSRNNWKRAHAAKYEREKLSHDDAF